MVKPKTVNLINEATLKKAFPGKVKTSGGGLKILVVLGIVGLVVFSIQQFSNVGSSGIKLAALKRKMQETKTKLNSLRTEALDLEKRKNEFQKEEALKNQRLDFLLSSSSQETNYANLLTMITTFIPEDLWIDHFEMNRSSVEISGSAFNPQLITQFINQLNDSGIFHNSHFSSSEKRMIDTQVVHNFKIATEPVWEVLSRADLPAGSGKE